ncbi:hypothetical protein PROFUN_07797 [Planoprotostelium fungivorum]|uniref:FZ domain-containing protein n=1 Tax=Planoprotostelium fungivorum TaxID=1890364 RepID=A0A2P6MX38_9EUKA|nr:hypothetical protein PROFUN_07797 [Planoprotostelium fungivorum]
MTEIWNGQHKDNQPIATAERVEQIIRWQPDMNSRRLIFCSFFLVFIQITTAQPSMMSALSMPLIEQCAGETCSNYDGLFCRYSDGSAIVNYTFCNCTKIPSSDGTLNDWYPFCGQDNLDLMAQSFYERATGIKVLSVSVVQLNCRNALREHACFQAFRKCVDGSDPPIDYMSICRQTCYNIKTHCQTSEDCSVYPITECTGTQGNHV